MIVVSTFRHFVCRHFVCRHFVCRHSVVVAMATVWCLLSAGAFAQQQATPQEEPEEASPVSYPALACPAGLEPKLVPTFAGIMARDSTSGVVTVQFVITTEGKVEHARILASSGGRNEPIFRRAALRTAARWQYEPMPDACTMVQDIPYNVGGD
jgi:TonB family protein